MLIQSWRYKALAVITRHKSQLSLFLWCKWIRNRGFWRQCLSVYFGSSTLAKENSEMEMEIVW